MKKSLRVGLLVFFAALALTLAACGSEADDVAADGGAGSGDAAVLPVDEGNDPEPPAAGACLVGEPECNDTPGGTPQDLPPPSDSSVDVPSGMVVDGLTVGEAMGGDATGVIAVRGFLFVDEAGARLCDLLAESFPPQCGGDAIAIVDFEEVLGAPVQSSQGVSWTDQHVTFVGEIIDGVFVVDPMVSQ